MGRGLIGFVLEKLVVDRIGHHEDLTIGEAQVPVIVDRRRADRQDAVHKLAGKAEDQLLDEFVGAVARRADTRCIVAHQYFDPEWPGLKHGAPVIGPRIAMYPQGVELSPAKAPEQAVIYRPPQTPGRLILAPPPRQQMIQARQKFMVVATQKRHVPHYDAFEPIAPEL